MSHPVFWYVNPVVLMPTFLLTWDPIPLLRDPIWMSKQVNNHHLKLVTNNVCVNLLNALSLKSTLQEVNKCLQIFACRASFSRIHVFLMLRQNKIVPQLVDQYNDMIIQLNINDTPIIDHNNNENDGTFSYRINTPSVL